MKIISNFIRIYKNNDYICKRKIIGNMEVEYKGYSIVESLCGYVKYFFHVTDDEHVVGDGNTIQECKDQIDEID